LILFSEQRGMMGRNDVFFRKSWTQKTAHIAEEHAQRWGREGKVSRKGRIVKRSIHRSRWPREKGTTSKRNGPKAQSGWGEGERTKENYTNPGTIWSPAPRRKSPDHFSLTGQGERERTGVCEGGGGPKKLSSILEKRAFGL